MPNIVSTGNLLPLVGTPAFLPSMLSYIRNGSSGTLPLDPVIFQAILLCIIAGDKHLLLHTQEEDVSIVVRLAAWILSSIFDLTTHKLRIKPQLEVASHFTSPASATDRSPFLRSLFLRSDRDEPSQVSGKSKTPNSRNDHSPSHSKKFRPMQYARSASFPSEASFSVTSTSQRLDNYSSNHQSQSIVPPRPRTAEQRSPFTAIPRTPVFPAHSTRRETRPMFPQALVVSGLEHASVLDQRAFAQVLAEKRVVLEERAFHESSSLKSNTLTGSGRGRERLDSSNAFDAERLEDDDCDVWNTPEGFIAVYVCPWNPRERPNIQRTLLDKFAISTTIVVLNSIRHTMRTLPFSSGHSILHPVHSQSASNPPTPSPSQALLPPQSQTPPPATRSHAHHHHSYRYSHSNAPPLVAKHLPPDFLHALRTTCQQTYIAPILSMYLADLFSATRHHPRLDGTFLTVRAKEDAEDLARASRVLGVDPTGSELVRHPDNVLYPYVDYDDDESMQGRYDTDEVGSGSVNVNNAIAGTYADVDPDSGIQNQPEVLTTGAEGQQVNLEPLYVSEADIARIVPRVVTHRLRVRSGPQDEVLSSAVFGATFGDDIDNGRDGGLTYDSQGTRSTVKDILVEILGDV